KVNEKVEQLLGFVKGIGAFVEKHKVPIVSTLAAVSAGLGTLGLIALYGKFQKVAEVTSKVVGLFKLWTGEMGLVKGTLDLLVTAIGPATLIIAGIVAVVAAVAGALTQLWMTNEEFRNKVTAAWEGLKETLSLFYDTVIGPVFTSFKEALMMIWTDGVQPLWDGWVEFVRSISSALLDFWNDVLKDYVDWFIKTFGPILSNVLDIVMKAFSFAMSTIGRLVGTVFKNIGARVEGLVGVFIGLITFIRGVFTGDWKMAWNGVVKIFDSITTAIGKIWGNTWDCILKVFNTGGKVFDGIKAGIVNAFSAIVNALIGGINKIIALPF
ncbi:hypothetical protein PT159_08905, partial [Erysipelothrix rhusiopathiae]|nr:hypothetical protein [Erysipelothrix rhusiopathiae]